MTENQIFHNFKLIDGVNPDIRPGCWLEVSGGRIRRIGTGPYPSADSIMDLNGRTVIPGLIDAHVHLAYTFTTRINTASLFISTPQIKRNLASCINSGVTTVRDLGCTPGLIRQMKRWIGGKKAIGPRIVCANSFIIPPGATPETVPSFPWPVHLLLGGQPAERMTKPDQVRGAVRRMVASGADWIKTTHTDRSLWIGRPDPPVFDDACFRALVDEAHRNNRPVAMHQTQASGFRKALELGVESMEHSPLDTLTDDDISRFVKAGIPIIPTISVLRDPTQLAQVGALMETEGSSRLCQESLRQMKSLLQIYRDGITAETARKDYYLNGAMLERQMPAMLDNIRRLHAAGGTIGFGTDSGGNSFAMFGQSHREIKNLVEAGLSPLEALQSATAINAKILRLDNDLGTLQAGKLADFVLLDGNPLKDITAYRRVRLVLQEGNIVYRGTGF